MTTSPAATQPVSALDSQPPLPLLVINLGGSQVQMGQQHGEILRQFGGWQRTIAYYPQMVEQMLRGSAMRPADRAMPRLAKPALDALARRLYRDRPLELRARTEAFMLALGVDAKHARHVLAMDMFQNAIGIAGRHLLGPFGDPWIRKGVPACSTLMAWGSATHDGALLHGRNFDFPGVGVWDQAPAVVFCAPDDGIAYGFATARGADVPAISAFNEAGLVVTPHTRLHKDIAFSGAAIVDLCHQIARHATTLAQAEAIVRQRKVASTWGIAVSSGKEGRSAVIEAHAAGVGVTFADGDTPWKTCTNHYLAPELRERELAPAPGWTWHTHSRRKRLEQLATQIAATDKLTPLGLFACLGDRRDADRPELERVAGGVLAQSTGVHTVVVEPHKAKLHVSVGRCPSARSAIQTVAWDWLTPVGGREIAAALAHPALQDSAFDPGGALHLAYSHYLRAAQLEAQGGQPSEVEDQLVAAHMAAPDDPTLLLLAGAVALRRSAFALAYRRFGHGSAVEQSPFPCGRLHLWAMRTARLRGDIDNEERHRQALLGLEHPLLAVLHGQARQERTKPWRKRRMSHCPLHTLLGDIG